MNLKGKLHQLRLVFSSALHNTIDITKNKYNTTTKYTIKTQYKKQTYNTITKNIHDATKTTNDITTIKN